MSTERGEILIAAPGGAQREPRWAPLPLAPPLGEPPEGGEGVGRLERHDDALRARHRLGGLESLPIARDDVLGAPGRLESRVLGAHAWVVQARADRVRLDALPVFVGEDQGPRAMEDA